MATVSQCFGAAAALSVSSVNSRKLHLPSRRSLPGRKASFFVVRSDAGVSSGSNSKARRADQLITNVVATKADGAAASTASKPGGEMMRGAGGPLLCIGDLLSDVGESDASPPPQQPETSSSSFVSSSDQSLDLTKLFQENYEQLNEALDGTDHSWAALTLKLCSALETANKLVQSTNSNVMSMSEKVGELEGVIKRADSAISAARVVHGSLNKKEGPLIGNQNAK